MKNNYLNNPDHHIWNNNGTWWAHYTVHNDDYTKKRVRVSLGTNDVAIARALRDFIMEATPKIASNIPRSHGSHSLPYPSAQSKRHAYILPPENAPCQPSS